MFVVYFYVEFSVRRREMLVEGSNKIEIERRRDLEKSEGVKRS
jgi:hypothetical protein